MRLLITRPEPGASDLAARLEAAGHETLIEPLLSAEPRDGEPVDTSAAQALIVTSPQALLALSRRPENLAPLLALPLYAVGAATAGLARRLGFTTIHQGPGTAAELCALLVAQCHPGSGAIVHLAGDRLAHDVAGDLGARGFRVSTSIVYSMRQPSSLSDTALAALSSGWVQGVVLMSSRTARVYASLVCRHELQEAVVGIRHFCLSAQIAADLGGLQRVALRIAGRPSTEELIGLIAHERE